jgi:hypothetical protein
MVFAAHSSVWVVLPTPNPVDDQQPHVVDRRLPFDPRFYGFREPL